MSLELSPEGFSLKRLSDVYNMQLSNEPAEELAQLLIDESKGVFSLCGFVCGGDSRTNTVPGL